MDIEQRLKLEEILKEKVFGVSEFLDFLNKILVPIEAVVEGEIGAKINQRPNWTLFNLLDKNRSILKCFCWKEIVENLGISLKEGMKIRVRGYPEIRKEYGEIRFQVQKIELLGDGILKKQFEFLKKKLAKEGYFDLKFKKEVPKFCQNIGLITSQYGRGALKDFLTHLAPFDFKIYFYDTRVEGINAIFEIIQAINYFNQIPQKMDVLVLTRGGGDWESLKPFNSEEIVKAIFSSKIPIVTGIGHEDDETLADLASDLRASTPTHAAKILSENWILAKREIVSFEKTIFLSIKGIFEKTNLNLDLIKENITSRVEKKLSKKEKIDELFKIINFAFKRCFERFNFLKNDFKKNIFKIENFLKKENEKITWQKDNLIETQERWMSFLIQALKESETKLGLSNPLFKLKQGFSITFDKDGKIIKDARNLKLRQMVKTKFYKGQALSLIKRIKND